MVVGLTMQYDSMTLLELKTMCKDRGLRVSGNKAEIVIRLMEDDESKSPAPQEINLGSTQQITQQITQQPTQIFITNNNANLPMIIGLGIIIYGFIRAGYSLMWSEFTPTDSFIGLFISFVYIIGGTITLQGYKAGLYITTGALVISGGLSLIFAGEFSPLTVVWVGDDPAMSLLCSGFCIVMVTAPLFAADQNSFRDGSPSYVKTILGFLDTMSPLPFPLIGPEDDRIETKVVKKCTHCGVQLKLPVDYKGKAKCPSCNQSFEVQ